jgi:two-component system, OmpR family, sensor histidine kinase CiaH
MFHAARWRLTLWFVLVLGAIVAVTGVAVYFTARAALFDQVNSDLKSRVRQERPSLAGQLAPPAPEPPRDISIGPQFPVGGYFYALVDSSGAVLTTNPSVDPAGLADAGTVEQALSSGEAFADTKSSEGDPLRVYVVRVQGPSDEQLLMEVGRSTHPERQALRQLVMILAGGGGAGLLLAFAGGYLLAGLTLRPIRAAIDSQRAFIADASHELRTPLSVVRASAELLKRHASQPVAANRETVDDIIAQSDRLGGLVGQMLTLTRVDAGQAVLSISEVALDEVVEEVGRSMRLLAAERGISLETNVSGPVRLRGDADRLRELMVILTDNAIKYTDAGGEVRLELRRSSGGKAVVRVSDTGRGIPPEALPRIFDRFYRVDKARSREAGGTGLGLAIARWIVEAHGGSIRVESTVGVGTTMTVELPV